ncbi:MAG: CynX/NimT family MFS transporter [Roseobacter sp.]
MRWRILGLLFLARTGLGFQFQTLGSVGGDLSAAFGMDYASIGMLIGLFMAPGLFLALPAGYLGRWFADRQMAVLGLMALAIGGVVSASSVGGAGIGLGRLIAGAGFLFATLYCTKMVAEWFEGREIATAMSVFVMSWPFGIAMGQVGHAWLAETYGWRLPFLVASAYCFAMACVLMHFYRAPDDRSAPVPGHAARLTGQEWRLVLCAGCAWGVFNAAYVTYLSFGPKVLEELGQSPVAAAGVISVASWIMIVSGALCGQVVDRSDKPYLILAVCMACAVSALWALSLPGAGLVASLLFGLVGMAPAGVIMAFVGGALRPDTRAFGMGVFFMIYHVLMMATPPVAGAVLDATGQAQGPIWLAMGLFALVVPLSLTFRSIKASAKTPKPRAA